MPNPRVITGLEGFDEDFCNLLSKFQLKDSVRYTDFAKCWTDMHFSLVYLGRPTKELLTFTHLAFEYLLDIFAKTELFIVKVCAIYTIYGLYYKQPLEGYVKITILLDDWMLIKEFIKDLEDANHLDTLFITLKLIYDEAFRHCIVPIKKTDFFYVKNYRDKDKSKVVDTEIVEDLLEELDVVETEYREAKDEIRETEEFPMIQLSNNALVEEIRDIFYKKPKQKDTPAQRKIAAMPG